MDQDVQAGRECKKGRSGNVYFALSPPGWSVHYLPMFYDRFKIYLGTIYFTYVAQSTIVFISILDPLQDSAGSQPPRDTRARRTGKWFFYEVR